MRQLVGILCIAGVGFAQTRSVTDPGVITTRQVITPAGTPAVFDGRVYGVAFGDDASTVWVANAKNLYRLDWRQNRTVETVPLAGTPGLQGIQFDAVGHRPLTSGMRKGRVALVDAKGVVAEDLGRSQAGAIAVGSKRNLALVPLTANNQVAVIDLAKGRVIGKAATGIAPFGAAISHDGTVAFVTNWGGRKAKAGEVTSPTGVAEGADQVVVDARGIASTGTVTRIDLRTLETTHTIAVGLHPTALAWDETAGRLYIANGNSDSVSVIDTKRMLVVQTFAIAPFAVKAAGIAPTALALSKDRGTVYIACGGINAIAVADARTGAVRGMIPTAWYPNSVTVSTDGDWIAVSALLGVGSGWRDSPNRRYVHSNRGTVAVLPVPDAAQLANYTSVVARNTRLDLPGVPQRAAAPSNQPLPIPARAGDPTPIEHVVYIIKENRTYDQVFGDIEKGNGDKSLVMFGRDVTPNQHKLAEEFVLLDNFYATGGNSADGHQWLTQANEVDYCMWPGYAGRSYPYDGTDPIAYSKSGFLWDYALARGKTVRIYGEFAGHLPTPIPERLKMLDQWRKGEDFTHRWNTIARIAPLNRILAHNYPAWTTNIPDVARAQIFLADLKQMEASGSMPSLTVIQTAANHTNGTEAGSSTPKAMVADNDLAVGQIVEALTKSRFWPKMAILIIEDDAQNGVDHVDGHRTVALAVSPYVRRSAVDSTFYSSQSMVKTIELILGLPTMSLFDLIAEDMRASFQTKPDLTPYAALMPEVSMFEVNPPVKALKGPAREAAIASAKMRFDIPDAAPTEKLNRILWHNVRGWDTPYPGATHAVFAPFTLDEDDDEREERRR